MRWLQIVGPLLLVAAAGCSHVTGSKSSKSNDSPACTYVAKLDAIADSVARADVHDPDKFKATMAAAVRDYVTNVRELRDVAPANLHAGLVRVEADVEQLRFDAALTDRAELDAYAARACGRVAASPASASASSTSTTPTSLAALGSGTSVDTGSTTTIVASAG
jgi:hypothetical protein